MHSLRYSLRSGFSAVTIFFLLEVLLAPALQGQKTRKTVFIIADGIPADIIEKLPLPNLQAIAKKGGYTRSYVGGITGSYNETPTISAVGYNSVLTGVWANKHNVWDNDIADPNYHYPTIFRLLKQEYPAKTTAIFSSWEDNRTKLVGDRLAATGNFAIDQAFDGLEHDTIHYPHDRQSDYMNHIDEAVAKKAAETIRTKAPDLSWVYLEYTDDMGHAHGDGVEMYNAVKLADKRIGYVWQAIQYRQQHFNEEWLIIVTTDHGRDSINGKGHGGQSARERSSWIFTNAKNLNAEFRSPRTAATDIMPSIARFMRIHIPKEQAYELDGTPFIGGLSLVSPVFNYNHDSLHIQWKALGSRGNVHVLASTTNQFKTGGNDKYILLGTWPLSAEKAGFPLNWQGSPFYKIVLEADLNSSNYWIEKK